MARNNNEDIGKFARHPLRTMGGAFAAGATWGAGMMMAKHRREKSPLQKFMDRIASKMPD